MDERELELELIERARAGDAKALDALLARVEPLVYRFGRKLCQDPEDARGVLQDTMLTLVRSLRDFRGASALSTWLYAVARSHCSKRHRARRRAPPMASIEGDAGVAEQLASDAPDPAAALKQRQLAAVLEHAIRALDEKYRDVLVLRDVEGLPAGEVAQVMGLTVEAVKSRLHRARASVRERVAPILGLAVPPQPGGRKPCLDIVRLFSRHVEGDLSSNISAEMEKHLEACGFCQASCDSLKKTLALCRLSPAPEVPPARPRPSHRRRASR